MTAASFPPCHRQTSSTYTRYAIVGLPSAGQKISPPWRHLFRPACVRPGTPPINVHRGRRPEVERSGTNALGVRRPVSAAALLSCRAGPACPAGKHAYRAAGHMGPALPSGCGKAPVGADDSVRPPSPYLYTNNKERTTCTRSSCASWARSS